MICFVLSTPLVIPHPKVRVNDGVAVLLTVRSAPTQSLTLWLDVPVVAVELVVNLAVLSTVVHVPAVPATTFE